MNPLALFGDAGDGLGKSLQSLLSGASYKTLGLAGLQGVTGVAGALASIGANRRNAQSQRDNYLLQAQDENINADQAYVQGVGQIAGLRALLSNAIGQRAAIAGASGIDGGQGVVQDTNRAIAQNSLTAEGVDRANANIIAQRHRMNALALQMKGLQATSDAEAGANAQLGSGILSGLLSVGKLFQ